MSKSLLFIISILSFVSCTRDQSIEPENINCLSTVNTDDSSTHKYTIKLQIDGVSIPDSVDFTSNTIHTNLGSIYFKRFINPTLSLLDSGLVYGKEGNDITIIIYNTDTTKLFTSKIFKNNILQIQKTGHTNSINNKIITTYNL